MSPILSTFRSGAPAVILSAEYFFPTGNRSYDVSADGRRFLMIKEAGARDGGDSRTLNVVQHWTEALKRLVPMN